MLPTLLLAALLQTAAPVTLECANIVTAQTPALKSSSGIEAALKVDASDDHGKNSHLCQADFTLSVTKQDGAHTAVPGLFSDDAEWGRLLSIQMAGFSKDENRVFAIISTGGKTPSRLIVSYRLKDGVIEMADLRRVFRKSLSVPCIAALALIGTAPSGDVVLGVQQTGPCPAAVRWRIRLSDDRTASAGAPIEHHATRLPASTAVIPLDDAKR